MSTASEKITLYLVYTRFYPSRAQGGYDAPHSLHFSPHTANRSSELLARRAIITVVRTCSDDGFSLYYGLLKRSGEKMNILVASIEVSWDAVSDVAWVRVQGGRIVDIGDDEKKIQGMVECRVVRA